MSPDVILLVLIAVPVLALMVLRVNAALVFLSVCLGSVLLKYVGDEAAYFAGVFLPKVDPNTLRLILLLIPVVLTSLIMIKTVKGRSLFFNILPAVGTGLVLAFLVVPLLPTGVHHNVVASETWHQVQQCQALIVGLSALICLFILWAQRPKYRGEDKHHLK